MVAGVSGNSSFAKRSLAIMKILIDAGARVNQADNDGDTALHTAAGAGNIKGVRILLEHGAKLEAKDKNGRTPLFFAAGGSRSETVKVLLDAGADIKARDSDGKTVLHVLRGGSFGGDLMATAKVLVDHGADVNAVSKSDTALGHALSFEDKALAEYLLKHGLDVNVRSPEGKTSLHSQAVLSSFDNSTIGTAAWLLDRGADIEARDNKGMTPLMVAAKWGSYEMVEFLLSRGAKVGVKDAQGKNITASSQKKGDILLAALKKEQSGTSNPKAESESSSSSGTGKQGNSLAKVIDAYADVVNEAGREYQQAKEKTVKARGFFGLKTRKDVQARQQTFADMRDKVVKINVLLRDAKKIAWQAVQENKVKATREASDAAVQKEFGDRIGELQMKLFQAQFYWADAYSNIYALLDENWGKWQVNEKTKRLHASDKTFEEKLKKEMEVIAQLEDALASLQQ
jgi:ankyrin repeat protein